MSSIAVVGCGLWGRNLVRNLAELGALAVVCDESPGALDWVRERYGRAGLAPSMDQVLEDPGIAAVMIATPASTHVALVRRVLEAGKDVFVEKPLALTSAEGRSLVHMAERRGRILMVGHVLEYHPAVIRLRELVVRGDLGKIFWPLHPRTRAALGRRSVESARALHMVTPVGYWEMLALERDARLVLTDSGGVQKEAYWLGKPCITLRDETEWVETLSEGRNRLAGADPVRILAAAEALLQHPGFPPPRVVPTGAAATIVQALVTMRHPVEADPRDRFA